jgi:hypothetical protein
MDSVRQVLSIAVMLRIVRQLTQQRNLANATEQAPKWLPIFTLKAPVSE